MTTTTVRLRPEVKAKWLEALRSGNYKQGQSYLAAEIDDGEVFYCCLGVLCELAAQEGVVQPERRQPSGDPDDEAGNEAEANGYAGMVRYIDPLTGAVGVTMPTRVVANWAFDGDEPPMGGAEWMVEWAPSGDSDYTIHTGLAELNDDQGLSFAEIANVIEASL